MDERRMWVGTYTEGPDGAGPGKGAGVYEVVRAGNGELRLAGPPVPTDGPSYLAAHPTLPVRYAVAEGEPGGITAWEVRDGRPWRPLGTRTVPAAPCHLAVRPDGAALAVACYGGGALVVQPLDEAGGFAGEPAVHPGSGSGPRTDRQEGPHVHGVAWAPDGTLLSTDLGADVVRAHRGGEATGLALPAGSGPRHLVLHPAGFAYVLAELTATVFVLAPEDGDWTRLRVLEGFPATAAPVGYGSWCAAIRLGSDARHLYTSTRVADVLTVHEVTDGGAGLSVLADVPAGGRWPRDIAVDGPWLYAALQFSDRVAVFRRDERTGLLESTRHTLDVPSPACVLPD